MLIMNQRLNYATNAEKKEFKAPISTFSYVLSQKE